ncbi:tRNA epoxyqueuosine(34) reductase QueG [Beijerinckia indica]|uniref:Epoxyqueuosine reductase n=1 Tax=Beijerinckia indica subsp. indica (strain ATCC 9039 / DSM 1715 / NCIMB 8712) TaxID=395963 RepID=B2IDU1_BEII9|nr:tRNA epoxyqueuosine(34) reductase QueG [Beijerinckia indica]ACB96873.1 iron-sulfur cluster binding protein [Beijerinckia indica subsp. indica ATCC 9039]
MDQTQEKAFKIALLNEARAQGFTLCRVTHPGALPDAPVRLRAWLDKGAAGDMDWMRETEARRADPRILWPEVQSIIMLGMNYGPAEPPLAHLFEPERGNISVYARGRDYHDVIKGRLKLLAGWLLAHARKTRLVAEEPALKVFIDTAPVMEKPLAAAAGLGWQGRHSNLVSREAGSWLFLGSIFTTLPLSPDRPESDHCGSCHACLDICPTSAFPQPYVLDARRCISYLTIEHKGPIPPEFRKKIGNRIYGCDDCLAVCPWNKFAKAASETKLLARAEWTAPPLHLLLGLNDAAFRRFFAGSPIKRIGRVRFLRNVLIAAGNSGDRSLIVSVRTLLDDEAPLVRGAAIWALAELLPRTEFLTLAGRLAPREKDMSVLLEWVQAGVTEKGVFA